MPDWKPHLRPRLASLRLSPTREAEIVEELSQHLDDRWHELVAAGHSADEATRQAFKELGDGGLLTKHLAELRQARQRDPVVPGTTSGSWWRDFWLDQRYALRAMRKRPLFALAAILTLALGIGSNAAIFAVINGVLLRPLPFPESQRLFELYTRYLPSSGYDFPFFALSGPEFADIASRVEGIERLAAYSFERRNLALDDGQAERVLTMAVTPGFFDTLGVKPEQGRTFSADEGKLGAGCFAVLSHEESSRRAAAVGSQIRLDSDPCAVIGVLPEGFWFRTDQVKVWTPLVVNTEETEENRWSHSLLAIARVRDNVQPEQADSQMESLRAYWSERFPDHYAKGHFAFLRPLHEDIVGDQRDALLLLGGAVLFVLVIVCVNLAALLISNGERRKREFALRHALGADRRRLIRQLVAEALSLAATGGLLGVLVARTLLTALLALYPQSLPVWQSIAIDYPALLYTGFLVVVTGLLVGLAPALSAVGSKIHESLRGDSRTATASKRAVTARSGLVVSQLALSFVLLVGALLLIRSYQRLQEVDLGVVTDRRLTFSLSIPPGRQPDAAAARRRLAEIEERLAAIPGVESAGAISDLPFESAGAADDFLIEGRPEPEPGTQAWNAYYLMATPNAFRALGVPLKRGRQLSESDQPGHPLVAVINETAARLFWPGSDPIDRSIRYYPRETSPSIRIVGVVGDVRSKGAQQPAPPAIYVPFAQAPRPPYEGRGANFVVGFSGDPANVGDSLRQAVASIEPGLPLANLRPMAVVASATIVQPRFTTVVMSFFAVVAFLLAALGLYGVLAYLVEQRVREIGVRVALGAGKREILRLVVGNGMGLAFLGVIIGVPVALALTRSMSGSLTGLSSTDPVTYIAVVGLLAISALLASYIPARRATKVDPIIALRAD